MTRQKRKVVVREERLGTLRAFGSLGHEQSRSGKVMNTLDRVSGGQSGLLAHEGWDTETLTTG